MKEVVDLTRDLAEAARWSATVEQIDSLLAETLDALGGIVPFDLATVMELDQGELHVRMARGELDDPSIRQHRLRLDDFPSIREVIASGRARAFDEHDHAQNGDPFDGILDLPRGHSCMVVPLKDGSSPLGVMTLDRATCGAYADSAVEFADVVGKLLAQVINHGEQSMRLDRLLAQLREQNRLLRERSDQPDACRLIDATVSPAMRHVAHLARQVSTTNAPVLLTGETGTGKGLTAAAIHGWSNRSEKPFIELNCAALPATLIESELFGHVEGAFSGATRTRIGRFQAANGGTLFLDEIGELPVELQPKLLRVLQEGCFEPVGSDTTVRVDVRIIAASNRDLLSDVEGGEFREDLYYRLAVFPIHLPPLRARTEDIEVIAEQELVQLAAHHGRSAWHLPQSELRKLQSYHWPGNVRELSNTLERAAILSSGDALRIELPGSHRTFEQPSPAMPQPDDFPSLDEAERQHILAALRRTEGKVHGEDGAAELLDIHPNTLLSRMKKLGLGTARDHKPPRN
jgi:transcriptional regulator with GAF, ATPase, and Fis domain